MSRKQLVDISGQRVQTDGGREVLVEGQEVWGEWMGRTLSRRHILEGNWRGKAKEQWRAMEQAAVRRGWTKDMERDKVYDRG